MKNHHSIYYACSGLALACATTAWAQEPADASGAAADNRGAEFSEIVVTAQKREQTIGSVPLAITAATGEELQNLGVSNVDDLGKIEPSLVASTSTLGRPLYSIRGIGFNSDAVGAWPSVSVYVDEVPFPFSALSKGATLDVERVEVLKGPQGTLFGQNSTGGAVNFIAAKPTDEFSLGINAQYSRFDAVTLEGFVSGPITDTLKARIALKMEQGGAWQYSATRPDEKLGDKNNKYGRLLLDWTPTDALKLSININGWTNKSEPQAPQNFAYAPQFAAFGAFVPLMSGAPTFNDKIRAADWAPQARPQNDEEFYQGSLRADYSVSDNVEITYLGTYEHYKQVDTIGYSGTATPNWGVSHAKVTSTSHELRASGVLANDKLKWMIGGNYAKHKDDESQYTRVDGLTTAYVVGIIAGTFPQPLVDGANVMTQDIESKAIFGSLEYALLDNVNLYGSARYTDTDNDHSGCPTVVTALGAMQLTAVQNLLRAGAGLPPGPPIPIGGCSGFDPVTFLAAEVNDSLNEDNVSWRVGFDFTPVRGTMLYANVSRGYKAGSFANLGVSNNAGLLPAVQEKLTAYEAGVKSRLADGALDVNGAVFYYDYRNKQQQLKVPDPTFNLLSKLLNVPKSRVLGAELSVVARPARGVTLDASATYLDSKVIGDFFNYSQFATGRTDTTNFKGEPLPNTPKWSISAGANFEWPVTSDLDAFFGGDVRYQTKNQSYFGSFSDAAKGFPTMVNDGYALLNLRAGVKSADGRWRVQVFGDNVLNEYYTTQAFRLDNVARFVGRPATYGVRVGYRY